MAQSIGTIFQEHTVKGIDISLTVQITNKEGRLYFQSETTPNGFISFNSSDVRQRLLKYWRLGRNRAAWTPIDGREPFCICLLRVEGEYVFLQVELEDRFNEVPEAVVMESGRYFTIGGMVTKREFEKLISILVQHTP